MRIIYLLCVFLFLFITSCKDQKKENHGAIVLGDSTTILVETNPEYLADFVPDINAAKEDTAAPLPSSDTVVAATLPTDTVTKEVPKPEAIPIVKSGKGLQLDFSEVTVSIPNIDTKSFKNQNLKTLNGASYQLVAGALVGNQLVTKGATIQKVSQRHITTLVVAKEGKKLELDNMEETTDWKVISGSKGVYPIKGIEPAVLSSKNASIAAIRNAVSKAARNRRMTRGEIAEWEKLARTIKSPNQPPVTVMLQSVMWRIEGKDTKGKSFRKEVRIDLPIQ